MRYMASIYVSDVMDLIALTVEIQGWTEDYGPPELVYQKTLTYPGVGADLPHEWLARALFLASEEITTPTAKGGGGRCAMGGGYTISETGDRRI